MRKAYQRISVLAAVGLSMAMTVQVLGASGGPGEVSRWRQDEKGWWLLNWNGTYPVEEWQKVSGKWYYFDAEGYMMANSWIQTDGKYYRVGEDGAMLDSQEIHIDGKTYTLNEHGEVTDGNPEELSEEEKAARAYAQEVVSRITNENMNKPQKAAAIYSWVRGNMRYTTSGPKSDQAASALYGFRRHSGCCYEYFAMSHYLLEAAGMPNIPVVRASDGDHFWNLVNVDGSWYHFDATPRRDNGTWCLVTTDVLRNTWGSHNFNVEEYPQTP